MKRIKRSLYALLVFFSLWMPAKAITVYETVNTENEYGGGWDVNIFADDVHFHSGGIITNLTMHLAIKGTGQTCRVWFFDQLGADAMYTVDFTNQPSSTPLDFVQYDFPMYLSVPADIYVGFSAEGDGWDEQMFDSSSLATTVSNGVVSGDGFYWWGAVEGGQLVQGANFNSHDYFELKIDMIQPEISIVDVNGSEIELSVTNISEHAIYVVERSLNLASNDWHYADEVFTNLPAFSWSEEISNQWDHASYRIRVKAE